MPMVFQKRPGLERKKSWEIRPYFLGLAWLGRESIKKGVKKGVKKGFPTGFTEKTGQLLEFPYLLKKPGFFVKKKRWTFCCVPIPTRPNQPDFVFYPNPMSKYEKNEKLPFFIADQA